MTGWMQCCNRRSMSGKRGREYPHWRATQTDHSLICLFSYAASSTKPISPPACMLPWLVKCSKLPHVKRHKLLISKPRLRVQPLSKWTSTHQSLSPSLMIRRTLQQKYSSLPAPIQLPQRSGQPGAEPKRNPPNYRTPSRLSSCRPRPEQPHDRHQRSLYSRSSQRQPLQLPLNPSNHRQPLKLRMHSLLLRHLASRRLELYPNPCNS